MFGTGLSISTAASGVELQYVLWGGKPRRPAAEVAGLCGRAAGPSPATKASSDSDPVNLVGAVFRRGCCRPPPPPIPRGIPVGEAPVPTMPWEERRQLTVAAFRGKAFCQTRDGAEGRGGEGSPGSGSRPPAAAYRRWRSFTRARFLRLGPAKSAARGGLLRSSFGGRDRSASPRSGVARALRRRRGSRLPASRPRVVACVEGVRAP